MSTAHEPCGRKEVIADRRAQVFALRKAGNSQRAIAKKTGIPASTVRGDIRAELDKRKAQLDADVPAFRAMEFERLEECRLALRARLTNETSNNDAIRIVGELVRVSESLRRLMGLDLGGGSTFNTINASGGGSVTFQYVRLPETVEQPAAVPVVSQFIEQGAPA